MHDNGDVVVPSHRKQRNKGHSIHRQKMISEQGRYHFDAQLFFSSCITILWFLLKGLTVRTAISISPRTKSKMNNKEAYGALDDYS